MIPSIVQPARIPWTDWETRFSTASRTVPVSGKPAAPPVEEKPIGVSGRSLNAPTLQVGVPLRQPLRAVVKTYKKLGRPPKPRSDRNPMPSVSPVAAAPCVFDGGEHSWGPHSKKAWRCVKCDRKVFKYRIPDWQNITIVRRPRVARTELPACKDPRGHAPLAKDGTIKGVMRLRCNRCDQTRKATAEELAGQ